MKYTLVLISFAALAIFGCSSPPKSDVIEYTEREKQLIAALELKDPVFAVKLLAAFDRVVALEQRAASMQPGEITTDNSGNIQAEDLTVENLSIEKKLERAKESVRTLLIKAVELMSASTSRYAAGKRLKDSLERLYPERQITIPPSDRLVLSNVTRPVPDERFSSLPDAGRYFYEHPLYVELQDQGVTPKGAVPSLFAIQGKGFSTAPGQNRQIRTPIELLRAVESGGCESIIGCLAYPEDCGQRYDEPPYELTSPISSACSEARRKEVFEAALNSGWGGIEAHLPGNDPWADELIEKYKDSPFLPVIPSPQLRPLTEAESTELNEKLSEFKRKFLSELARNNKTPTVIYDNLRAEFRFEKAKMQEQFDKIALEWVLKSKGIKRSRK